MKRLLLALLLFSSPVLADKYTIYTTERPPSSWSGIIDSEGYYYWLTNGYPPALKHKCDILAGATGNACFIKTNEKPDLRAANAVIPSLHTLLTLDSLAIGARLKAIKKYQ